MISLFRFRVVVALAAFNLVISSASMAQQANTLTIEKHLGAIFDLADRKDDLWAIEEKTNQYALTVKSALLLDLFKMKPTGVFFPRRVTFDVKDLGDGAWQFETATRFSASIGEKSKAGSMLGTVNVTMARLNGQFDLRPGQSSNLALTIKDLRTNLESKTGSDSYSAERMDMALRESPQPDRLSTIVFDESLHNAHFTALIGSKAHQNVRFGKVDLHSETRGIDYRSLKGKLRFGEKLDMQTSEETVDFPVNSVISMGGYDLALDIRNIISTENDDGVEITDLHLTSSGVQPDENSINRVEIRFSGLSPILRKRSLLAERVFPKSGRFKANMTGFDYRLAYLQVVPISQLGVDNRLDYVTYSFFNDDRVFTFTDIESNLQFMDGELTWSGAFSIGLDDGKIRTASLTIRTRDLERMIAGVPVPGTAPEQAEANTAKFFLYMLKGLAHRRDDGSSEWVIMREIGGVPTINGSTLQFPDMAKLGKALQTAPAAK
ncbi:MAG: hypothetical protein RLZZ444_931 [Pseudomonadota bacterium]